jgi:hypothetical protein
MPLLPQNPLSHKAKGEWLLAPAVNESQVARRDSPSNGWRNVALLGLRAEMDPFKQRAMRHGVRDEPGARGRHLIDNAPTHVPCAHPPRPSRQARPAE